MREPDQSSQERASLARILPIILFAILLIWLIARHSLVAGLSRDYPEIAKFLNPSVTSLITADAQRIVNRAISGNSKTEGSEQPQDTSAQDVKTSLGAKQSPPSTREVSQARGSLYALIEREPANATAFRLLGQIASLARDPKSAAQMMYQSTQLSLHDPVALYEMLLRSIKVKSYSSAVYYTDAFLRGFPDNYGVIAPLVMELMVSDQARPLLVKTLAENPPWRALFLNSSFSAAGLVDVTAPLKLLIALKETGTPPQLKELSGYINFLNEKKQYDLAYSSWLLFLPDELMDQTGLVFNGSFETEPTGLLYDWYIGSGSEVEAGITSHPDDESKRVLYVEFGIGRTVFPVIQQRIMLTPGIYRMSFLVKGEILARRGLEWQVICENGQQVDEGKTILGRHQSWRRFFSNLVIPKDGCHYQTLRLTHLARSSSEQMAQGHLWFDDLSIQRVNDIQDLGGKAP